MSQTASFEDFLKDVPDNLKGIAVALTCDIAMDCNVEFGDIAVERPNGEKQFKALTVTVELVPNAKVSVLIVDDEVVVILEINGQPPKGVSRPIAETPASAVMQFVRSIFMGEPN